MEPSRKANSNIRYNKVWRRKKQQAYQENEDAPVTMILGFVKSKGSIDSMMEYVKV